MKVDSRRKGGKIILKCGQVERDCRKVICGALAILQGYWIDYTRLVNQRTQLWCPCDLARSLDRLLVNQRTHCVKADLRDSALKQHPLIIPGKEVSETSFTRAAFPCQKSRENTN